MAVSEAALKPNRVRGKGRPRTVETAAASLAEILNLVRKQRARTRQELERASQYGRAVIADRLAMLAENRLIDESETGIATGGRAPRIVRFAKDRAMLVVVTLDQSAIGVGLADLSGSLITEHHEATDLGAPSRGIVARVAALVRWIISRQAVATEIWGISISVPGPVVTEQDSPFLDRTPSFLPTWEASGLVEKLVGEFRIPVWINSNIETMTMGELHGGEGQGHNTMLFVRIGKRIGAGFAFGGQPFRGSTGAVGLIGQLPIVQDGVSANLDSLAGTEMFRREGMMAAQSGRSKNLADVLSRAGEITENDVCQAAQLGDPVCTEILTRSGKLVGGVVATLANMLNPELIVLAGTVAQTNDIMLASVREAVYGASHPLVTRDLRILRSQMSGSAALLGAARMGVESLFLQDILKDWIIAGTPKSHVALVHLLEKLDRGEAAEVVGGARPPAN